MVASLYWCSKSLDLIRYFAKNDNANEIIIEIDRYTEHKYVYNNETIEDENGYVVIESKLCKNCGVGHIYKDYFDNNGLLYKEEDYIEIEM